MGKNTKLHTIIMSVFILYGIYLVYTEPFDTQSIVLIGTLILSLAIVVVINIQERINMAEEKKESKAERVMLTMSSKLKETIEKEAEKIGINTTQYIINLIVNDLKK